MLVAAYTFLDLFWSMLVFFLWIMWFWLLFTVWFDIFRRHDTSGLTKALWLIFTIVLPFLGVFIYLISQNDGMTKRNIERSRKSSESSSTVTCVIRPEAEGAAVQRTRSRAGKSCSTEV